MSWYIPPEPKLGGYPSARIYSTFTNYEENVGILFGGENKSKILHDIFMLDGMQKITE